jgi:hypothetical protein
MFKHGNGSAGSRSLTRAFVIGGTALALVMSGGVSAMAAPGNSGGHGGGGAKGPYSLLFGNCSGGVVATGFTQGPSVDGGKRSVNVNGADCYADSPGANSIASVAFQGFWDITLDSGVSSLKMSTLGPLTQGGSPRISVELYDGNVDNYTGLNTLFLDPSTCGTPNGTGWTNSDFRHGTNCTITDSLGNSYSNWDAMLASRDHLGDQIWYAYVIADQPTVNRVDRITLNGQLFTS